jgi:hypothetical protein
MFFPLKRSHFLLSLVTIIVLLLFTLRANAETTTNTKPDLGANKTAVSTSQKPEADYKIYWQEFKYFLHNYQSPLLALFCGMVLIITLRNLRPPPAASFDDDLETPPIESRSSNGMMRIIIFGLAIFLIIYFVRSTFWPKPADKPKAVAQAKANEPLAGPAIPCRFVGAWQSRQKKADYLVNLYDDGSFTALPFLASRSEEPSYTGSWSVYGNKITWLHDEQQLGNDINVIVSESEGAFTLTEVNGDTTRFELMKRLPSNICKF